MLAASVLVCKALVVELEDASVSLVVVVLSDVVDVSLVVLVVSLAVV